MIKHSQIKKACFIATVVALSFFFHTKVESQVIKRAEFAELKQYNAKYNNIVSLEDKGLIYYAFCNKETKVRLDHYSPDLVKVKSETFQIERNMGILFSTVSGDSCYVFMRGGNKDFTILVSDAITHQSKKVKGLLPARTYIRSFDALGSFCYFMGNVGNKDVLFQIDLSNGRVKEVPVKIENFRSGDVVPQDIQIVGDQLFLFSKVYHNRTDSEIYLTKFDKKGKLLSTANISKGIREKIVSLKAELINDRLIIGGSYTKSKGNYTNGVFLANIEGVDIKNPEFYNITDLPSFALGYSHRVQKMLDRKKRRSENKDKELLLKASSKTHPPVKSKSGCYLVTEFYTPVYNKKGQIVSFMTSHAVVIKFDNNGKLVWDGSIKIDVESGVLRRYVRVSEADNEELTLAMGYGSIITYRTFSSTGEVVKEGYVDLTEVDGVKARRTSSLITPSANGDFFVFGEQLLKNKGKVRFIEQISVKN